MTTKGAARSCVTLGVAALLLASCARPSADAPGDTSARGETSTPTLASTATYQGPTPTSRPTATVLATLTGEQRETNEREQELINSLSIPMSIETFRQILGLNLFYQESPNGQYAEYVFYRPFYYVQAITDAAGDVLFYAVTSCDESFRPTVYTPANRDRGVQLAVTTYREMSTSPDGHHVRTSVATANAYGFEWLYGDEETEYRDLVWGSVDERLCPSFGLDHTLENYYMGWIGQQEVDAWRESHVFNTVGAGNVDLAISSFQIGVDRTRVRVCSHQCLRASYSSLPSSPSSGWQEAEQERIDSLSTLVTIELFEVILGAPYRERLSDDGLAAEYSFARPGYWVQAVTDKHGSVSYYAVTSCSEDFKPVVPPTMPHPVVFPFTLRVSPIPGDSGEWSGYGGNPSLYQSYYLGNNDACSPGQNGSANTFGVLGIDRDWQTERPSPFQIGVEGAWVGEHPDSE